MFFRNSVWNTHLYISRFGCKRGAQIEIITHVNYGLKHDIFWEEIEFLLTMCVKYDQQHLYSLRLLAVIFDHCHLIARHPMLTTSSFTWNSKKKTKTVLWLFWKRSLQGELTSSGLWNLFQIKCWMVTSNWPKLKWWKTSGFCTNCIIVCAEFNARIG